MAENTTYRTILRSSFIIGLASLINILTGLVKMKAAAILLGPAGVGLIGLYQNLMGTAAKISSLGISSAGTRQIAASHANEEDDVNKVRLALLWGSIGLALVGAVVFLFMSQISASWILQQPDRQPEIAWLAIGVAATVLTSYQAALLTGLRRIGDLARVQVLSGIISASIGVLAIWRWGTEGLVTLVLIAPIIAFLVGYYFTSRINLPRTVKPSLTELSREWRLVASLGFIFMISNVLCLVGDLMVRTLVQRELGLHALGHFQAAWAIGIAYLGFVLTAMGTDFYPRLSSAIKEPKEVIRLINEQTEVALLLCAPALLALLGFTPWVIRLLYSAEFMPVVDVLRLQLLGDAFKVMSWPLSLSLMAAGAGRTFFLPNYSVQAYWYCLSQ